MNAKTNEMFFFTTVSLAYGRTFIFPGDRHLSTFENIQAYVHCGNISPAMAVNPELLKILVCPLCKAPVNLTENGQGLKCTQCSRVYPIRDDIPVMLISEAKVEN
jgi:uncharacterized protein